MQRVHWFRCSACIGFDAARAMDSMQRGGIGIVLGLGLESGTRFVGAEESDSIWDRIGIGSRCYFLSELVVGVCGDEESL